jgi:hypothetical protein
VIGAGVLVALLPTVLTDGVPRLRPSFGVAFALAVCIALDGDHGLVRGGCAGIAVAAASLVALRSASDVRLAAGVFGATAAVVAAVAAVHGDTGTRADILAVSAALGLGLAGGARLWGIAAADLAGALALPSRTGLIAIAAALSALVYADRRNLRGSLVGALAVAAAYLAGVPAARAPFDREAWRHASGYVDSYHRLGVAGCALFALLLVALLRELPRALTPVAVAAGVGAAFVPLEATAPLWLIVGFAGAGPAYDRFMATSRARRLEQIERSLVSQLREVDAERRRLAARRAGLDARENEVSALGAQARARDGVLAEREAAAAALERDMVTREANEPAPASAPPPPPPPTPRFRPAPAPEQGAPPPAVPAQILVPDELKPPPPSPPMAQLQPAPRRWSLRGLDALVAARGAAFPDRVEEWRGYIAALESHAIDGVLPETLDQLVRDVFGPILDAPSG